MGKKKSRKNVGRKGGVCEYKGKRCEYWEDDGVGSCGALDPSQCPENTEEDVKSIRDWQRQSMKSAVRKDNVKKNSRKCN